MKNTNFFHKKSMSDSWKMIKKRTRLVLEKTPFLSLVDLIKIFKKSEVKCLEVVKNVTINPLFLLCRRYWRKILKKMSYIFRWSRKKYSQKVRVCSSVRLCIIIHIFLVPRPTGYSEMQSLAKQKGKNPLRNQQQQNVTAWK